ncbi:TIGR03084 family metal-binding protein [Gandjariella thermophila]|uniref:TIGR03084 family protein n=1 Tax=Gandjariella thermophila TaxID=1931992 RepID=A0A4D4J2I6_9PSEU|nr:TIGR03084 family metal-binding protein [Gandjariella thermophila]GDY28819.1 TIGR03084 family protein [Gandjariella thermophila]
MTDLAALQHDLAEESAELDALVAGLESPAWATPTPAEGWTVAHQIAHLAWTDRVAVLAATDGAAFAEVRKAAMTHPDLVSRTAEEGAGDPPAELLDRWRTGRAALADALRALPPGTRLPWFGPPMSAPSMVTARLMETWAHGQDVADALGAHRRPTARLRHVAHLGVRTMAFAFALHGLPEPDRPVRVELTGPGGEPWTWGPEDAEDRVTGPALDFCLLVTQRRHPDDLAVIAVGELARRWLPIAQAFAGPAGAGRKAGQFG